MAEDRAKYGNALVSYYVKLWNVKYPGGKLKINRYSVKWGFMDVVDSVGMERGKEILDYYFKTSRPGHPIQWFLYNFDKLDGIMDELADDELNKINVRAQTKARVEEWERRQNELRNETD